MARMACKVVSCFVLLLVLALPGYVQAQSNITYVYDDRSGFMTSLLAPLLCHADRRIMAFVRRAFT